MTDSSDTQSPLALPVPQLDVNGDGKMRFDALGPLVVNSDGVSIPLRCKRSAEHV